MCTVILSIIYGTVKTDHSSNLIFHYHIQYKVRKVIKGGAPQCKFLQKVQLCPGEVVTMTKEIASLKNELIKVRNEKMEIEAQNSELLKRAEENETEIHRLKKSR